MPRTKKEHIAHGALQPKRSVYDIIGANLSRYETNDVEEYIGKCQKMNLADLQDHAMKVGVMPLSTQGQERLLTNLKRKFLEEQYRFGTGPTKMEGAKIKDPDKIKDILSKGR